VGGDFEGDVSDDQRDNGLPAGGEKLSRRRAMKVLGAGGVVAATLMLPSKWTKPVVESIIVPAHAQASAPPTTISGSIASDVRLKRDIERVGELGSGIALYRFRYLWSDEVFVGVMAQEVLRIAPEAVIRESSGFMSVDYTRLGTRMMRWDEWLAQGRSKTSSDGVAIALGA
jgi:hypothetical protein